MAEDETIFALSLVELLEIWDYEVLEPVSSGEEAIRAAESGQPDIIIMDVGLKGPVDGIGAAMRMREKLMVPVIFISGYDYEGTMERIKKLAPAVLFNKPLDISRLKSEIEKMLHLS
ncbi:MAG: response regulator [Nitrospiraceae bacterium]|nr:response regulator [Nitrospiraceae bacterium]